MEFPLVYCKVKGGFIKAVICPVCNGVGKVSSGFYNRVGDCPTWSSVGGLELCRSCNGKGWVEVQGDPADIKPYILPNPYPPCYAYPSITWHWHEPTWHWATT